MMVTEKTRNGIGSVPWWRNVVNAWNKSAHYRSLAGLGVVQFEVSESNIDPVCVQWDANGYASIVDRKADDVLCFRASQENWTAFVCGQIGAVTGVFRGDLRYEGPFRRLLPYAK